MLRILILGFILAALVSTVHAETKPSIQTTVLVSEVQLAYSAGWCGSAPAYSSPISACIASDACRTAKNIRPYSLGGVAVMPKNECWTHLSDGTFRLFGGYGVYPQCPTGSSWNGQGCVTTTYSCEANQGWSLSADQLSCSRPDCPAGYTRDPNTSACLAPCPAGQVRNMSTMQCEIACQAPLIRTDANTCDCPNPLTLIDGNTCIGREDKDLGEQSCQQPESSSNPADLFPE